MLELLNSCAWAFDFPILDWIHANMANGFMDVVMPIITLFGDGGVFWILCAVAMLFSPKTRKVGLTMGLALAMGLLVCNITIKPLVGRPRPVDLLASKDIYLPFAVKAMHDFSFPSGHTIASFEASVVLLMNNKKLGIPAVILAILISFSRLYLYVHYPTDVLVSVVLGTLFAILAQVIMKRVNLPERTNRGKYERAA